MVDRRVHRRAPTPSTPSRSCRWRPPSWPAARRVLDVGCGDGQISRLAAAARRRRRGRRRRPDVEPDHGRRGARRADRVRAGRRRRLPFADGSFDAVVACLVFEHIDDVDAAIAEVARVLAPGGRFCFFLNHPLLQTPGSGWIDDQVLDPPEQYWRIGPYLPEAVTIEEVEPGVHIRFVHRPLSRYVNALADHGLLLERMVEPAPPPGFLALAPEYGDAATVPRLLYLRCLANGRVTSLARGGGDRADHGHVGRRPVRGRRRARGPRLVRRRQPARRRWSRRSSSWRRSRAAASTGWRSSPGATTAPCSTTSPRCAPAGTA